MLWVILQDCALYREKPDLEFSASSDETIEKRMNNKNRELILCLKMADNGQYYNELTVHAFSDNIYM